MTNSIELMTKSAAEASVVAKNLRPMAERLRITVDAKSVATDALLIHADMLSQQKASQESFIPEEGYWIIDQHWVNVTQEQYVEKGELTPEEALELAVTGGYVGFSSE